MDRLATSLILGALRRLAHGRLEITLPDGSKVSFGQQDGEEPVRVRVREWSFFRRLLLEGDTGAGAAYIDGVWECDDLVALVRLAIANQEVLEDGMALSWLGGALDRLLHRVRRNTVRGSRRNIREHYDLSDEFFSLFLDPSMTYSCAYWEDAGASLEEAQRSKYRRIAAKARLAEGDHVLEIGCGWGAFAEFAAREYGCRVTGVTVSQSQAEYARDRVLKSGLADQVSIELADYRSVRGRFDQIVSIEMLEAVGHEYLPLFFRRCDELLAEDGIAVLQAITIPDQRYARYRRRPDYIQRYIFPGSHLPCLRAIVNALADHTSLGLEEVENIGMHYAETLRRWRSRFLEQREEVRDLGFDESFIRRWNYYLAYCEGGFASRYINDLQIVLTRAGNESLPQWPYQTNESPERAEPASEFPYIPQGARV